jgi:hypothetical protein
VNFAADPEDPRMAKLERYRAPSPQRLLRHVLEHPGLVAAVRELPAPVLGKLIDAIGLESAGELVALTTTAQLERVFDEDLWREDAVGDDPRFDPARFALWLEVMLEAGDDAVAKRLVELPLDFLILAVQRLVLVVDMDRLGEELGEGEDEGEDKDEREQLEKALDSSLCEEWEEFRLIARDHRAFDSVLQALLALDREHHDVLRRILERCCAASAEHIDDNGGLYAVLSSDEMLESDARAERDDRRGASGYVAPSDARSFLALARQGLGDDAERDPVTRAYFRELERDGEPSAPKRSRKPSSARRAPEPKAPEVAELVGLLEEAGATAQAALVSAPGDALLARALTQLSETHPAIHAERLDELGFLANVVVAGEPHGGRRYRPIEALELVVTVVGEALERELAATRARAGDATAASAHLRERHLDQLFRRGWHARATSSRA